MTKTSRKIVRVGLILLLILTATLASTYLIYNEPLPLGKYGPEADELAHKMLKAINNEAYQDTRYLEWTFRNGNHRYKWDKKIGKVNVSWDVFKVDLNLDNHGKSRVFENNIEVKASKKLELIKKAVDLFNNDSFWLVAPFKVFDKGTKRSLVKLKNGATGLMITYESGGTTPGDSYLWKLQPNGFPESFGMWVKILPLGGIEATWDEWQIMESGAFLPKSHMIGPIKLDMGEVKGYN